MSPLHTLTPTLKDTSLAKLQQTLTTTLNGPRDIKTYWKVLKLMKKIGEIVKAGQKIWN